jgi:hypothetical protein
MMPAHMQLPVATPGGRVHVSRGDLAIGKCDQGLTCLLSLSPETSQSLAARETGLELGIAAVRADVDSFHPGEGDGKTVLHSAQG